MKKETFNTFNEGLNKDLNPIVTPNNVLTDNLNGTYITFNGDELSLQNDAGNTKIPIKWDKRLSIEYVEGGSYNSGVIVKTTNNSDETVLFKSTKDNNTDFIWREDGSINTDSWELFDPVVKLSKGFYPIGIREYGGVLYIVSANKETNKVEFGSYPAPILSKGALMPGHDVRITSSLIDNLLYETVLLNDYSFKTGGYATFNNLNAGSIEHLQIPPSKNSAGRAGMYRVRLIHQLNNGSFDLTEDVWEKFFEHKENSGTEKIHWIDSTDGDKTFKYLCPNQYKGKLAIIVELDEPPVFEFSLLPTIELKEDSYEVTLNNIIYEGSDSIPITGFNWILTYSDGTKIGPMPGDSFPIKVPKEYNLVTYEITPETGYNWENFPKVFKDKYTLRGTVLLAEKYYSIYLERASGGCRLSTSEKEYRMLVLSNSSGELGIDFENTLGNEKAVVFLLEGHSLTEEEEQNYLVLGRYEIVENKASLLELDPTYEAAIKTLPEGEELLKVVKSQLEETIVLEKDDSCNFINITIKFNLGFNMKTPTEVEEGRLKFYQKDGNTSRELPFTVVDYRTFEVEVSADKDLHIWAKMGHADTWEFNLSKEDYSEGEIYNYAITMKPLTYVISDAWTELPTYLEFQTNWVDSVNVGTIVAFAREIHTYFLPEENDGREITGYKGVLGYASNDTPASTMLIRIENPGFTNMGRHSSGIGETVMSEYKNLLPDEWLKVGTEELGYLIVPMKPVFQVSYFNNVI